jgi:integrase
MRPRRHGGEPVSGYSLTHQVRVWDKLRVYQGRNRRTYTVRWVTNGKEHRKTFPTRALARSFRSMLVSYTNKGVPFDISSGLPEPVLRAERSCTWFVFACEYADMKWDGLAPKSRRSMADALATVTPALIGSVRGAPTKDEIRGVMYSWALVTPRRQAGRPADAHDADVADWLARNTADLAVFDDIEAGNDLTRRALDTLAHRMDGKPASANTVNRKRAVFFNALDYAVERRLISGNPVSRINWSAPRTSGTVDRRCVVNQAQAERLLSAVAERAPRLAAFFACQYYAAMRPGEVIDLSEDEIVSLPEHGWGEFLLSGSMPRSGADWTDSGKSRERRSLKHRAPEDTRPVPIHPRLGEYLRDHIERFGIGPGGRIFVGPLGGRVAESEYLAVWHKARQDALTPAEVESPLARRPYDLRHAAISTQLNAGVSAAQVAEWAGNSVDVVNRVYTKCIVGEDAAARDKIEAAMRSTAEDDGDRVSEGGDGA